MMSLQHTRFGQAHSLRNPPGPLIGTRVLTRRRALLKRPARAASDNSCCGASSFSSKPPASADSSPSPYSSLDEAVGPAVAAHSEEGEHHHHHHHSTGEEQREENAAQKLLRTFFTATGATKLSEAVHEDLKTSLAMCFLFVVAAVTASLTGVFIRYSRWLALTSTACQTAIYIVAGIPEFMELCMHVASGQVNTHVLMTLAVIGTLAMGAALEGGLLLVLFQLSHALEESLTAKARGSLASLLERAPQTATLIDFSPGSNGAEPDFGKLREERAGSVAVGAQMLVRPGELVPLDGTVVWGQALVSSEHITGEAVPVSRSPGAEIPAGARVHDGVLVLTATRVADDSTPARIARLTSNAQASKPRLRRYLDSFGDAYSKLVIFGTLASLAALTLRGVPLLGAGAQKGALYRSMGLLTAASPCALVLVPLAYVAAIASMTQRQGFFLRGVLVKGGRVLDALTQCSTVAFDKTGTLTTGVLAATGMLSLGGKGAGGSSSHTGVEWWKAVLGGERSPADMAALATATSLSQRATHPVSQAMTKLGERVGAGVLPKVAIRNFSLAPGAGVSGEVETGGLTYNSLFGSLTYAQNAIEGEAQRAELASLVASQGSERMVSVLVMTRLGGNGADEGQIIRLFTFDDEVRASSAAAVSELQEGRWGGGSLFPWGNQRRRVKDSMRVLMLTGDSQAGAVRVARQLGLKDAAVHAELTPEQKLAAISVERLAGRGVIMVLPAKRGKLRAARTLLIGTVALLAEGKVGDGINDAPALAAASVGVAVAGTPSAAAAAAADVVVLTGDVAAALPLLLRVSRCTRQVVAQNLAIAVASILTVACPAVLGFIPLWLAVGLHEGSTLLVALNSLRLLTAAGALSSKPRLSEEQLDVPGGKEELKSHPLGGKGRTGVAQRSLATFRAL